MPPAGTTATSKSGASKAIGAGTGSWQALVRMHHIEDVLQRTIQSISGTDGSAKVFVPDAIACALLQAMNGAASIGSKGDSVLDQIANGKQKPGPLVSQAAAQALIAVSQWAQIDADSAGQSSGKAQATAKRGKAAAASSTGQNEPRKGSMVLQAFASIAGSFQNADLRWAGAASRLRSLEAA